MGDTSAPDVAHFIQAALDRAVAALLRKDAVGAVDALFAEDAVYVSPGATLVGREAIVEHFQRAVESPVEAWIRSDSVTVGGELAYETGTNAMTFAASDGTLTTIQGRYLTVWRRSDNGSWRIVADAPMRDPA